MVTPLKLKLVAATALLLGFVAAASAQSPSNSTDCVDCSSATGYDNELRQDRGASPAPAERGPNITPVIERRDDSRRAGDAPSNDCSDCPPPKKYDSQEVIKNTRDVDRSAVINTTTVVPVAPRIRERNHLVVHENQTRLVGTVQHNNLIIEKEIRYVRRPQPVVRYARPRVVTQPVYVIVQPSSGCGTCNGGGLFQALAAPQLNTSWLRPCSRWWRPNGGSPDGRPRHAGLRGGYYSSCGMVLR